MDTNKMREQFEAAYTAYCEKLGWKTYTAFHMLSEVYVRESTELSWQMWQASREAVVVELPKVVGFEGAYDSHRHHEFVPSMSDVEDAGEIFGLCRRVEDKEAIEALGLKVAP
ncbi:TPA: hypothetical protein U8203_000256 [Pseudomonas putida]|nr:hypothetical protein [Pseudomonas putida]HEN8714986.1 hypothetical protein [Pseudomonas putida]